MAFQSKGCGPWLALNRNGSNAPPRSWPKNSNSINTSSGLTNGDRATPDACLRWIESLRIPHGPRQGERFQLGDWQRDFLREVLDDESPRRRFGLTVARRNGKSVTAALLAAVYLVGPRIAQNREWRGGIVSLTLDHATEISTTLAKLGEANGLPLATQAKPAAVFGLYGSELLTLAATPRAGHGIGLDLALLDEVGLYDDNRQRAMLENMKSATVGRDGRTVAISIRGHSQLFEEFQQEAEAAPDIAYWQQHSAPPGAQLDDIEAIRAANPGLGDTVSEKALLDKARLAKNNASAAYFYRVQNLNLRGSPDKQAICAVHEYGTLHRLTNSHRVKGRPLLALTQARPIA